MSTAIVAQPRSPFAAPRSVAPPASGRLDSLDLVRGVVMVLMAIDHVRVYSGVPAGGADPAVFFTRWITHFCAPAFVFLAGTAAFLHGRKLADRGALARFLFTRGLLLVALELTLIRFFWTFTVPDSGAILAGVIWMLGWCMVLLAALIRLPARWLGLLGVAIILFQDVFGIVPRFFPGAPPQSFGWAWELFYPAGFDGPPGVWVLYHLIPWIGVMAAGYGFGLIVALDEERRRQLCFRIGLGATALFLVAASAMAIVQSAEDAPPFLVQLLNQRKYPASQLFLLMTLGPTIALLPLAEQARGWLARAITTFGRVPMFYYLLHIPAIHVAAIGIMRSRGATQYQEWYAQAPGVWMPEEHRWSLLLLYAVFVAVTVALYFPCRRFAAMKARSESPWLRYL